MGLYGDRINPEQTRFQFDRIFNNRYEMDQAVATNTDNVFQGRFVLVKYDQEDFINPPIYDTIEGYMDDGGNIYADEEKTTPFVLTEFHQVTFNDEDDVDKYYYHFMINEQDFYFKINPLEYEQNDIYYTPDDTGDNAIYINQFIRIGDDFYQCDGEVNEALHFTKVARTQNPQYNYLNNYQWDKNHYSDFTIAGYDGTVWQKVYSEGYGRFVLVAYLDSKAPEFQLQAVPPTLEPGEIKINAEKSTDRAYRINVPSRWGFRVKEVGQNDNSDQSQDNIPLDIYYNFTDRQHHMTTHDKDVTTKNEIIIAPTGKDPNTVYYDSNGDVIPNVKDVMELSIHLPAIGNMIDEGYDLIYGYNNDTSRPRDTKWYEAGDVRIISGDSTLGGKTVDPSTLAGIVNSFQDRLGQIIKTHNSYPTDEEILTYEKDYIHEINGEYYYRDTGYEYDSVNVVASYSPCVLKEYEYKVNRYYIKRNDVYLPATEPFDENETYYIRNVQSTLYNEADILIYQPNTYYYHQGFNYVLDTAAEPTNVKQQYYSINPGSPKHFDYGENTTFYTADESFNTFTQLLPQPGEELDLSIPRYYLGINDGKMRQIAYGYVYYPNKFCYKDAEDKYHIETEQTYDRQKVYYTYTIDTSEIIYTVDDQGNILVGYRITPSNSAVTFVDDILAETEDYNSLYARVQTNPNVYQKVSTMTNIDRQYYYYSFNPGENFTEVNDKIFFGNKYYTLSNNTYILQAYFENSNTDYYDLTITPINKVFYEPGKYAKIENNEYIVLNETSAEILSSGLNIFYKPQSLFVISDTSEDNPYQNGCKWNANYKYVPASVTLGVRQEKDTLIPIPNINNGESSLNGILLNLNRIYGKNNEYSRDLDTFLGCINTFKDLLAEIKDIQEDKLLYVNKFGQVETTNYSYSDFINLMQKVDALGEVSDQ